MGGEVEGMVSGGFKHITFIAHSVSIITVSAPSGIRPCLGECPHAASASGGDSPGHRWEEGHSETPVSPTWHSLAFLLAHEPTSHPVWPAADSFQLAVGETSSNFHLSQWVNRGALSQLMWGLRLIQLWEFSL